MSQAQDAILLNNEGCFLMINNHEEEAMNKFKDALRIVRNGLTNDPPCSSSSCEASPTSKLSINPISVPSCPIVEDYFIYNNAMTVQCTWPQDNNTNFTLLSAMVVFNIALLSNVQGLRERSSTLQSRSLRLYEMALGLLEKLTWMERCQESELLYMGCLNNMSKIIYDSGDFDRSFLMLRNLRSLVTGSQYLEKSNTLDVTDLHGFMLNVMLTNPPSTAAAA